MAKRLYLLNYIKFKSITRPYSLPLKAKAAFPARAYFCLLCFSRRYLLKGLGVATYLGNTIGW
jgi:hypothetical protein